MSTRPHPNLPKLALESSYSGESDKFSSPLAWKKISFASCLPTQAKTKVSQGDMHQAYNALKVLAVPSVQLRKADQSNGHAMGTTYSQGLIIIFG
jgi:hypothetical protein